MPMLPPDSAMTESMTFAGRPVPSNFAIRPDVPIVVGSPAPPPPPAASVSPSSAFFTLSLRFSVITKSVTGTPPNVSALPALTA
jgi:hypothetical protein